MTVQIHTAPNERVNDVTVNRAKLAYYVAALYPH